MPCSTRLRSGSSSSKVRASRHIVVDSPPGITRASTRSSSSGLRTTAVAAPQVSSTRRCSRTSPCSASTPTVGTAVTDQPFEEESQPPYPQSYRGGRPPIFPGSAELEAAQGKFERKEPVGAAFGDVAAEQVLAG